jgi:hypothetical protein
MTLYDLLKNLRERFDPTALDLDEARWVFGFVTPPPEQERWSIRFRDGDYEIIEGTQEATLAFQASHAIFSMLLAVGNPHETVNRTDIMAWVSVISTHILRATHEGLRIDVNCHADGQSWHPRMPRRC